MEDMLNPLCRSILPTKRLTYPKPLQNMTPNRSSVVCKLEREIALLPVEDKLQLRDGLDLAKPTPRERQIRAAALGKSVSEIEAELTEMANDPDIQRELAAIKLEFTDNSMDGLRCRLRNRYKIINPIQGSEESRKSDFRAVGSIQSLPICRYQH
jgi:hypothetical protein